ncbi:peptidase M23 [Spirochaetia bacterium]|nr:peptidase M23 [Spirochaetia bacterium]
MPLISRLNPERDVVFKQFLDDVEQGRQAVRPPKANMGAQKITESLSIYTYKPSTADEFLYKPTGEDSFLRLAARCNIPIETIATLNRIEGNPRFPVRDLMLLPTIRGIFLPDDPQSDLERLIASTRGEDAGVPIVINLPDGKHHFRFIPGDEWTPNERAFFLNPGIFRFPLAHYVLTSNFGPRRSPISGKNSVHAGMDLAAPAGASVFAAGAGIVTEIGESPVYGKFIVITHNNLWTTLYGHLSNIETTLQKPVKAGTIIGNVGSTGLSTGPHLHFEMRQNGKAQDPGRYLGGAKTQ